MYLCNVFPGVDKKSVGECLQLIEIDFGFGVDIVYVPIECHPPGELDSKGSWVL